MHPIATVQDRGQVTIPKQIREAAGLRPGDRLHVRQLPGGVIERRPIRVMTWSEICAEYEFSVQVDVEDLIREAQEMNSSPD